MCKVFEPFLDDYVQGRLDADSRRAVEKHVPLCVSCEHEARLIKRVHRLASATPLFPPPQDLPFRIMNRIQTRPARSRSWQWFTAGFSTALAASLVLFFVIPQTIRHEASRRSDIVPVTFSIQLPAAKEVSLVGDFNDWDPAATRLKREGDVWTCTIDLKQGQYQYMFVIDGDKWQTDPKAVRQIEDGYGRKNALLTL